MANRMLVDTITLQGKVYHVFRDNDKKIVDHIDAMYEVFHGGSTKYVESKDKLKSSVISYWKRKEFMDNTPCTYQADMSLAVYKNIQWRKNNEECTYPLRVCHLDIEVYAGDQDINFSDLQLAASKFPISLITLYDNYTDKYYTIFNRQVYTGMDFINKDEIIKQIEEEKKLTIESVEDEKTKSNIVSMYEKIHGDNLEIIEVESLSELLKEFQRVFNSIDPDIVTGWNSGGFDIPYIFYSFQFCNMEWNNVHGKVFIDTFNSDDEKTLFVIPAVVNLDYLDLYKERSFGESESYKLGYIAAKELHVTKVAVEDSLDHMFTNTINKFIAYNIMDVHLVRMLDESLKYIDLVYAIIKETNISWSESFSTLRMIDGLLFSFLDKTNKTMKSRPKDTPDMDKLPGAFVRQPIKGVFAWLSDLDLTSLYPYITARYNMSPDTLVGVIEESEAYDYIYYHDKFMNSKEQLTLRVNDRKTQVSREKFDSIVKEYKLIMTIYGTMFKRHEDDTSILYEVIKMLIAQRKFYKKKMFAAIEDNDEMMITRYKNIQNTYKVLTNSLYGAIGNKYFRLFNYDVARSITTTGRELIKLAAYHVNEYIKNMSTSDSLDNVKYPEFNPNFYKDAEDVLDSVIYGDSVSGDSKISIDGVDMTFKELFDKYDGHVEKCYDGKEYILPENTVKTINENCEIVYEPIKYAVRHRTNKKKYKLVIEDKEIIVTEDHSMVVFRNESFVIVKPTEILSEDLVLIA